MREKKEEKVNNRKREEKGRKEKEKTREVGEINLIRQKGGKKREKEV